MSTLTVTIEEIEREFVVWRSNKKGQPSIPESLSNKVKIVLQSGRHSEVLRRLGLSMQQARNKGLLPSPTLSERHTQNSPISFIKIPITQSAINAVSSDTKSLTLQRGDIQLSLNHPSHEQIQLIINALLR
jgi:hypothetical protein